jgi:spermidine/putrescine transport system substrate-binding protein
MKIIFRHNLSKILLLVLLIIPMLFSCNESEKNRSKILKIYNWADYIDEDLLNEFPVWYKEQTGEDIRIVYQVFDMTEVMYTKIALGKEDFDLVCPTQAIIERMLKYNMLLPFQRDLGKTPNYFGNISPFIRERLDAFSLPDKKAENYVIPYMWGTSGILYNKKLVSEAEVSSWGCFWSPKNKGKMLMKDSYWDAYNVAAIYGFYDQIASGKRSLYHVANDHTDEDIAMVEKQLKLIKPYLAGWEADFGKDMMTQGEIWLSYAWSGDAVWAIDEASSVGVDLGYVVPKEGSNVWFDGWVIPKYAQNIKAASYFLDYLCQAQVALRNMDVSGYTSAVATPEIIEAFSDSSLMETVNMSYFFGSGNDRLQLNPIQFPDSTIVSRCAIINDFLDKNDAVLEMWSRAKGDSLNAGMAIMILSFFFLLAVWLIYRRIKKFQSKRRRNIRKKKNWVG